MITRLAPTPSGFLHTGNIYNFLLNWLWARTNNGKVLLRIDDEDAERKRPGYVADIFHVLDWLGLDWDIGPSGPDDFEKNWSQALRTTMHMDILHLLAAENMLFACECSRKNYQCNCIEKNIPLSQSGTAWRMKTVNNTIVEIRDKALGTVSIDLANTGAFVVKRKDGLPAYQLASLADDRHFAVTHICRGEDLLRSTAMQLYIDRYLDQPLFMHCNFWHHPLVTDATGSKLSKSTGGLGKHIMQLVTKEELIASFARWMGWNEKITLEEMVGTEIFVLGKTDRSKE